MAETGIPAFVESDVPAREFGYPEQITHVVFAQFGVQAGSQYRGDEFIAQLCSLLALADGPNKVERCHHWDNQGFHEDILMAYWMDLDEYHRWVNSAAFADWWSGLPEAGELGFWREIMTPDIARVGFNGFGIQADRLVGCTHVMRAVPGEKWGYWGGYRDRFQASHSGDTFESDIGTELPDPVRRETVGRRIKVQAPNNICFVREGASSTFITSPEERVVWDNEVKPVLDQWIQYLIDNPRLSGALSTRNTIEQDVESGEELEQYSVLCYLLTLRHLERAARTQPSHLALYNTYRGLLEEFGERGVTPELQTWVEAHILQRGTLELEYVNCHPETGFLAFFGGNEVIAD